MNVPHSSQNGSRGKHGRHAAPEQESSFFQPEQEFPHNPYEKRWPRSLCEPQGGGRTLASQKEAPW